MKNFYKSGEIVLVTVPFTDLQGYKVRPSLVLCDQQDADVLVVPISTTENMRKGNYVLKSQDYKQFPLPIASCVRWDKPITLKSSLIRKNIGQLKPEVLKDIKQKLINFIAA